MLVTPCDFLDFAGEFAKPAEAFDRPPEMTPEIIGRLMEAAPRYGMEIKLGHEMPVTITDAAHPKKRLWCMGEDVSYLATAADTGGQFTAVDIRTAPLGGPPPHAHHREDETFYVIEGQHSVTLGGETTLVGPGDCVFVPRGTTHAFSNTHPTQRGRILSFHTPGGFEKFFDEIGVPFDQHPAPPAPPALTRDQIAALFARHGMTA
jgi:mannose-6-phosphate isomerase-like protein (cupin superfamily)